MSEVRNFSTTEGRKEVTSSCTFLSKKNFLVSGITSVGLCEIMGLDYLTDCSTKISLQSLSFSEMLYTGILDAELHVIPVPLAL